MARRTSASGGTARPRTNRAAGGRGHNIAAVNNAVAVLKAVAALGRAAALKEIAAASRLSPSRAHRYLASLCQAGLIAQDAATGRYDLGEAVVELGVAALGRIDPVRLGAAALAGINALTGFDSHLNTWGSNGPTVVKWEQGRFGYAVKIREGRNLPLLLTATGRVFLAYLPEAETRPFVERELAMFGDDAPRLRPEAIARMRRDVRAHGLARTQRGDLNQSISALSAPVFDRDGRLSVTLTVLGITGAIDVDYDGETARHLRAAAAELSRRLGAPGGGAGGD